MPSIIVPERCWPMCLEDEKMTYSNNSRHYWSLSAFSSSIPTTGARMRVISINKSMRLENATRRKSNANTSPYALGSNAWPEKPSASRNSKKCMTSSSACSSIDSNLAMPFRSCSLNTYSLIYKYNYFVILPIRAIKIDSRCRAKPPSRHPGACRSVIGVRSSESPCTSVTCTARSAGGSSFGSSDNYGAKQADFHGYYPDLYVKA